MIVYKNKEFVNILKEIEKQPTVYYSVAGGNWCKWNGYSWNMDCVCMVKGVLWGFNFDKKASHGGAIYLSNGVADDNADGIMRRCYDVSTDFRNIKIGELMHMDGHVGVYIGDRKVVEATAWYNKVIISYVETDGRRTKDGNSGGYWKEHGKLEYIEYEDEPTPTPSPLNYKIGDSVKINGVYVSSDSKVKLNPLIKEGKITLIKDNARNPYLLNNGNIGWVNDECIVGFVNQKYLNLNPSVNSWCVYKTNKYYNPLNESDILIRLNPKKFDGLSYKILEDMGNFHFKIHTIYKGNGYIAGNPNKYPCTITDKPLYKNGDV